MLQPEFWLLFFSLALLVTVTTLTRMLSNSWRTTAIAAAMTTCGLMLWGSVMLAGMSS